MSMADFFIDHCFNVKLYVLKCISLYDFYSIRFIACHNVAKLTHVNVDLHVEPKFTSSKQVSMTVK